MLNDPDLTIERMEKTGKRIVAVLIILCAIVIGVMAFKIFTRETERRKQRVLSEQQEIIIGKYMKERKVRPQVIEVHYNGRMFYDLNGHKCEIK